MVAMICPEKTGDAASRLFHNQYMSASGKWESDLDRKATCRTDKVEILEYCKKVSLFSTLFVRDLWPHSKEEGEKKRAENLNWKNSKLGLEAEKRKHEVNAVKVGESPEISRFPPKKRGIERKLNSF